MDTEPSLLRIQAVFAERGRGAMSLEVRWILPGQVPATMIEWLGPFDDEIERREDQYLVNPSSEELGVKIKGAILLDLKVLRGSPGLLEIPQVVKAASRSGRSGRFPVDATGRSPGNASSWLTVQKVRRRRSFRLSEGQVIERALSEAELPGCTMELTEIAIGEAAWWSLGVEVHGGSDARSDAARNGRVAVPRSASQRHLARCRDTRCPTRDGSAREVDLRSERRSKVERLRAGRGVGRYGRG